MPNPSDPDYREQQKRVQLAVMLDALGGVQPTPEQQRVLEWLSGWEAYVCEAVADLFTACQEVRADRSDRLQRRARVQAYADNDGVAPEAGERS